MKSNCDQLNFNYRIRRVYLSSLSPLPTSCPSHPIAFHPPPTPPTHTESHVQKYNYKTSGFSPKHCLRLHSLRCCGTWQKHWYASL